MCRKLVRQIISLKSKIVFFTHPLVLNNFISFKFTSPSADLMWEWNLIRLKSWRSKKVRYALRVVVIKIDMIIKRHPFMNVLWIYSFIWSTKYFRCQNTLTFISGLEMIIWFCLECIMGSDIRWVKSLLELDYFLRWAFVMQLIFWWNVVLQFWVLQLWNQTAQCNWPFSAYLFFPFWIDVCCLLQVLSFAGELRK